MPGSELGNGSIELDLEIMQSVKQVEIKTVKIPKSGLQLMIFFIVDYFLY